MRVDYELESVYMDAAEKVNLGREFCSECGKYCYSEREAGHIINLNKRHHCNDHLGKVKKIPKRKYWCYSCGQFHLTSMPYYKSENMNAKWEERFYRKENQNEKKSNKKLA